MKVGMNVQVRVLGQRLHKSVHRMTGNGCHTCHFTKVRLLRFLATQTMRQKVLAFHLAVIKAILGLSTAQEAATGSVLLYIRGLVPPFSVFPLGKWPDCPACAVSPTQLSPLQSCDCRTFWNSEMTWLLNGQSRRGLMHLALGDMSG